MPRNEWHEWHVLTGSYALDALGAAEREAFERHLHHCASCDAEVRGLRETAARLAMARALRPPSGMQARVLAATYQTRQLPPLASDRPGRVRRAGMPRLVAAAAAASVAAALALGLTQVVTQHQSTASGSASAAVTRVLSAPDARTQTMRTTVGGTVILVVSRRLREAVVSTTGMPSLPVGRVYQLWVIGPVGARSAGLLSGTGQTGGALASSVLPGDRIGITVEPAPGTSRPTTTPVVVMALPA
jgi:anti-sigma-K factor RskA